MQLKIYNIDFIYGSENVVEKVRVRYDANENGNNINGAIEMTYDAYLAKASDLAALSTELKAKVVEQLSK